MSILRRVAIIYDDQMRPDTTGVYCRRGLGELVDVEHVLPSELARLRPGDFDLYLNIDDGLRYRLPADLHPCAWWAIDTHLDFDWYAEKGVDFDFVFAAQRDGAERLRSVGICSVAWLPLACDPEIHRPHNVVPEYNLCFVGHMFPGERERLVRELARRFAPMFVGRAFFDDMARTYSQSRIVFNRSIRNDINMRVFEALACGSLLVTNDLTDNGQEELFRNGRHLVTYSNDAELIDRVDHYLSHPDERLAVAARGRMEVVEKHTYRHRMQTILDTVTAGNRRSIFSAGIPQGDPRAQGSGNTQDLVSIVLVTRNDWPGTAACLDSIRRSTPEPHEVIVVDNGSTDGTRDRLRDQTDVIVIAHGDDRGYATAANQGLKAAKGHFLVLLSTRTIATSGWLEPLCQALRDPSSAVGLVGPVTNGLCGEQQVEIPDAGSASREAFVRHWIETHRGQRVETDRLDGFCLGFSRPVLQRVGLLDEGTGDDGVVADDYCRRVLAAGYRAFFIEDAFVFHGGSPACGAPVSVPESGHRPFRTV